MPLHKPFVVGIDPGVSTGIAVLRRQTAREKERVMQWCTKDFFSVQEYLKTVFPDRDQVKVFVEHPFGGHVMSKKGASLDGKMQDKYIGNAGGNRREAELLFASLVRQGWDVELVQPVKETKWDEKRFRLFTGQGGKNNQHERDAVRLAKYYADKRS